MRISNRARIRILKNKSLINNKTKNFSISKTLTDLILIYIENYLQNDIKNKLNQIKINTDNTINI